MLLGQSDWGQTDGKLSMIHAVPSDQPRAKYYDVLRLASFSLRVSRGLNFCENFQEQMSKTLKMLAEKVLKMKEYSRIGIPGSFTSY